MSILSILRNVISSFVWVLGVVPTCQNINSPGSLKTLSLIELVSDRRRSQLRIWSRFSQRRATSLRLLLHGPVVGSHGNVSLEWREEFL